MSQKFQRQCSLLPYFFKFAPKFHLNKSPSFTNIYLLQTHFPPKKRSKTTTNHTSAAFSLKSPQSPAHISSRAPAHHFSRFTLFRCSPVIQPTNVSATPTSSIKKKCRKVEVQKWSNFLLFGLLILIPSNVSNSHNNKTQIQISPSMNHEKLGINPFLS